MFAVIETGGKQYKVAEGQSLKVEKLPKPAGDGAVAFDKVLLIDDGKTTTIGDPYIKGAMVTAEFLNEGKGKKIIVLKFKNKIRYKKVTGHRQLYTQVKIKTLK